MYVTFNVLGDIDRITPAKVEFTEKTASQCVLFPAADVIDFVTGVKNIADYMVKTIIRPSGATYKIVKKVELEPRECLRRYLVDAKAVKQFDESDLVFELDCAARRVRLHIHPRLKFLLKESSSEDQVQPIYDFLSSTNSSFYACKRGNPYILIKAFTYNPVELFNLEVLEFECEEDLTTAGIYMQQRLASYSYFVTNVGRKQKKALAEQNC